MNARLKAQVSVIVADIPKGRVATYGAIGRFLRVNPRQVAKVLATLTPGESMELPWFRVVAANGIVSSKKVPGVGRRQIHRLRAEGIAVTTKGRVEDFAVVNWSPIERSSEGDVHEVELLSADSDSAARRSSRGDRRARRSAGGQRRRPG